jgi:YgiT-type zinc finger domain-containing protein
VATGFKDKKEVIMKCTVCGARMHAIITDLPFKLSEERIVILKQLPVLQCEACREYLIEDPVMARIDTLLSRADSTAELEVIHYAA